MKLKIQGVKPLKVGNSYYLLIPKQYINNDVIKLKQKYDLEIDESIK